MLTLSLSLSVCLYTPQYQIYTIQHRCDASANTYATMALLLVDLFLCILRRGFFFNFTVQFSVLMALVWQNIQVCYAWYKCKVCVLSSPMMIARKKVEVVNAHTGERLFQFAHFFRMTTERRQAHTHARATNRQKVCGDTMSGRREILKNCRTGEKMSV